MLRVAFYTFAILSMFYIFTAYLLVVTSNETDPKTGACYCNIFVVLCCLFYLITNKYFYIVVALLVNNGCSLYFESNDLFCMSSTIIYVSLFICD